MKNLSVALLLPISCLLLLSGCGGGGADVGFMGYSGGYTSGTTSNYGGGTSTLPNGSNATATFPQTLPVTNTQGAPSNQVNVIIEQNPAASALGAYSTNTPFVSINLCNASTQPAVCQTIDHVLVDTGSYGLRLLASAVNTNLNLPAIQNGPLVAECTTFVSGFMWGSIHTASLQMNGELAKNVSVQLVADSSLPPAPASCTGTGTDIGNLASIGGNGILGVGPLIQDQGSYYTCSAGSCTSTNLPLSSQVSNPVAFFALDNNGVLLQFPAIPASGQPSVTGTLTFGLNTQADNSLAGFSILPSDLSTYFNATIAGQAYPQSFIDSGSVYNYITLPGLTLNANGDYAPGSYTLYSATLSSNTTTPANPNPLPVEFGVLDSSVLNFTANAAFNDVVDPGSSGSADFGMSFFYGKTIGFALVGSTLPQGTGPFYALQCTSSNCL